MDVELSRKYNAFINYEEKRNMDEERELERAVGILKENAISMSCEERQEEEGNKKLG